jgi:ATP-dependent Clp protease protease subunit
MTNFNCIFWRVNFSKSQSHGQATDIEIHANEILRVKKKLNHIYEKHTVNSLKKIEGMMERDKFMDPEEARKTGLIDRVIAERTE